MTREGFLKLLKDRDLADDLIKCSGTAEVQKFLKEKGIDVTIDDLNKIRGEVIELSDEKMDEVAGGEGFYAIGEGILAFAEETGAAVMQFFQSW